MAAGLLVGIVTPYTGAVLGQRRRGYLVGAQHAALLLGSLALLLAIAGLMYLTRGVDWYACGGGD